MTPMCRVRRDEKNRRKLLTQADHGQRVSAVSDSAPHLHALSGPVKKYPDLPLMLKMGVRLSSDQHSQKSGDQI